MFWGWRRASQCSLVYSWKLVSAGRCRERGLFDRALLQTILGLEMQDLNSCLLPRFFFSSSSCPLPLRRGPRVLPPLCLPLKSPARWRTGMEVLPKVRKKLTPPGRPVCPTASEGDVFCKYRACLNHVHDLWCLALASPVSILFLYVLPSSSVFLRFSHLLMYYVSVNPFTNPIVGPVSYQLNGL